jgi:hypothetical protein
MRAHLDYLPPTTSAGKALLGEWRLVITQDDGAPVEELLADQGTCLARAKALGLTVIWSERARKAGWSGFRTGRRKRKP